MTVEIVFSLITSIMLPLCQNILMTKPSTSFSHTLMKCFIINQIVKGILQLFSEIFFADLEVNFIIVSSFINVF